MLVVYGCYVGVCGFYAGVCGSRQLSHVLVDSAVLALLLWPILSLFL